jgi:hypothetical protein
MINLKVSVKEMWKVMLVLALTLGVIKTLFHQNILILRKKI